MAPLHFFFLVFALTFGGALLGMRIQPLLREHHLSDDSQDMLKAARAVIVGLSALTLGMLLSSAKTSFETKGHEMKNQATKIIELGHLLDEYGPGARVAKATLQRVVASEIDHIDFVAKSDVDPEQEMGQRIMAGLRTDILNIKPDNDNHTWIKSTALGLAQQVLDSRWRLYMEFSSHLPRSLAVLLIFWLFCIFFSFGLLAPRNIVVLGGLAMASLSMSGTVFMVLELDAPFQGLITISTQPLKLALAQISRVN